MKIRALAILNLVTLLIHISISYASQLDLFGKNDVGEISDKYPSVFTPAGITFSIWGLIYLSLMAFAVYHLLCAVNKQPEHEANRNLRKIGTVFIVNNLATAAWVIAWTNELLWVSVVLILIQLITLIIIHHRLQIHKAEASQTSKLLTQFPLSIYLGWISIATIANISTYLTSINWNGWNVSAINWTLTMIAIAVLITIWVLNRKRNVAFGLVVIWALYGISLKRTEVDADAFQPIIILCYGGMAVVGLACVFSLIRNLRIKRMEGVEG